MNILIHDFAGHPFQIQLSRELSARGHRVTHVYPDGLPGPKGRLTRAADDPESFNIVAIPLSAAFSKYAPMRRFISQREYARTLKAQITKEDPDVVISGNTPVDIQLQILLSCRRQGIGFVHWVQDVYCQAIEFYLRRKVGKLAGVIAFPFTQIEKFVARRSDKVIVIASAFKAIMEAWGTDSRSITTIENWAPLDEIVPHARENDWKHEIGLSGKTLFLYAGTMGLKHRPDLIYSLAERLDGTATVVAVTEGIGRDYLEKMPARDNLKLLNFQPYEMLSQVLSAADVLVATLEGDAGTFAVPSKILTYLCAGRPILLSAPVTNLAAEVVSRSRAGFAVGPLDSTGWTNAAEQLASDAELRNRLSLNARQYAEEVFDVARIGGSFERVLNSACKSSSRVLENSPEATELL